ncbi:MAG TPA: HD domain-containing protein [Vampirovibrionales bacterium]
MDFEIDKAIKFASVAHKEQTRKGSNVPYISHLFAVALLLKDFGATKEQLMAGILHDTIEDTDVSYEDIEREFGKTVADYVESCSEVDLQDSWDLRKQQLIDGLHKAPPEVLLIVCADKIHNLMSIENDLKSIGEAVWDKFGKGRESQEWYYRELLKVISEKGNPLKQDYFDRLKRKIEDVFGR